MERVGVRELKDRLAYYLRTVRQGETVVVPRTEIEVDEGEGNKLTVLETGVTLQQLVDGLNALGVGPRDMISILQALKAAGALHANVEVM